MGQRARNMEQGRSQPSQERLVRTRKKIGQTESQTTEMVVQGQWC